MKKTSSKSSSRRQPFVNPYARAGYADFYIRDLRGLLPEAKRVGNAVGADAPIAAYFNFDPFETDHAKLQKDFTRAWERARKAGVDESHLKKIHDGHCHSLVDVSARAFLAGYYAGVSAPKGGAR